MVGMWAASLLRLSRSCASSPPFRALPAADEGPQRIAIHALPVKRVSKASASASDAMSELGPDRNGGFERAPSRACAWPNDIWEAAGWAPS